ncbi:MAG: HAD-IA family hydrolase [Candidatus Dojkabacteria bacterium]|nr:HAD-IA family hydrolase [Candidatus Dojkabacteria bacterium]
MTNQKSAKKFKFVYFDVGGVVVKDFSKTDKWKELLVDLGVDSGMWDDINEHFFRYEPKLCDGVMSLDQYQLLVGKDFKIKYPRNYSMLQDFVDRFEINPGIHPIIKDLKSRYKIGLLTNMYPGMFELIQRKNILPDVDWDVFIDSSIEGCSKPGEQIFVLAEDRSKVAPENILFVENTERHIEAAKRRGWKTLIYDSSDTTGSNREIRDYLGYGQVLVDKVLV